LSLFSFSKDKRSTILVFHSDALQLLQYERVNERYKLLGFNEVKLAEGVVKEGSISDMDAFKSSLADLFSNAKPESIKAKTLYVNIPHHLSYSFVHDFPHHLKRESLQKSMMDKVERHSPIPLEELSFDFAMIEKDHMISYAAYAIPKKWQDRLLKACEAVGVKSIEFVPESFAQIALLAEDSPALAGEDFALFSCHRDQVSISIFHSGLLDDSYQIGEFGEDLLVDCSQFLPEFKKAQEEIKAQFGSGLQSIFFAGFNEDQRETIKGQFKPEKASIAFIDGKDSPLSELIPYENLKLILFGLFNYITTR